MHYFKQAYGRIFSIVCDLGYKPCCAPGLKTPVSVKSDQTPIDISAGVYSNHKTIPLPYLSPHLALTRA